MGKVSKGYQVPCDQCGEMVLVDQDVALLVARGEGYFTCARCVFPPSRRFGRRVR
jgi:ribosomal protein L37E